MANTPRPTFAQREGLVPIPPQLQPGELSQEARAGLWAVIHQSLEGSKTHNYRPVLIAPWANIIRDWCVDTQHQMADQISTYAEGHMNRLAAMFRGGRYDEILGFCEYVLRHNACPLLVREGIAASLGQTRTAYTIIDGDTVCPVSSGEEAVAIAKAFGDLATTPFEGAKSHLKAAAEFLTAGKYADSVRESVHSVESTARLLTSKATSGLGPALAELEKSQAIHGAMKAGFGSLYGYSSDEKGIRHPLIDKEAAAVDQYDAMFLLGSCAAFVSYLIGKGRAAGLLKE